MGSGAPPEEPSWLAPEGSRAAGVYGATSRERPVGGRRFRARSSSNSPMMPAPRSISEGVAAAKAIRSPRSPDSSRQKSRPGASNTPRRAASRTNSSARTRGGSSIHAQSPPAGRVHRAPNGWCAPSVRARACARRANAAGSACGWVAHAGGVLEGGLEVQESRVAPKHGVGQPTDIEPFVIDRKRDDPSASSREDCQGHVPRRVLGEHHATRREKRVSDNREALRRAGGQQDLSAGERDPPTTEIAVHSRAHLRKAADRGVAEIRGLRERGTEGARNKGRRKEVDTGLRRMETDRARTRGLRQFDAERIGRHRGTHDKAGPRALAGA